jgi:uncharacterized protein (DUF362 family)
VVIAVAKMCLDAGAKSLVSLSRLSSKFWERTKLAERYGAVKLALKEPSRDYTEKQVVKGVALKTALVGKEMLDVDTFINIPIAKHHMGTNFTGNLKNFMGALASKTNTFFHIGSGKVDQGAPQGYEDVDFLSQCIADANTLRRADLCVADATVVLANNGPHGPGDLMRPQKVVAGTDAVAVDAYCVKLHKRRPEEIAMLVKAAAHGLGTVDLSKLTVRETTA